MCRERRGSRFIGRMAIRTGCRRLILVSLSFVFLDKTVTDKINGIGFNQIDLPQYSSYEKLRQQLLLAINEGGEGFGFA